MKIVLEIMAFDFHTPTGLAEIRELVQHAYAAGWIKRGPAPLTHKQIRNFLQAEYDRNLRAKKIELCGLTAVAT